VVGAPSAARRHLGYVLKRFPRISETFVAAELIELARQGERALRVHADERAERGIARLDSRQAISDELHGRDALVAHRLSQGHRGEIHCRTSRGR
jgi:hypothetical protein